MAPTDPGTGRGGPGSLQASAGVMSAHLPNKIPCPQRGMMLMPPDFSTRAYLIWPIRSTPWLCRACSRMSSSVRCIFFIRSYSSSPSLMRMTGTLSKSRDAEGEPHHRWRLRPRHVERVDVPVPRTGLDQRRWSDVLHFNAGGQVVADDVFALLPRTALGSTAMIQFPVLPLRTNRSYPAERPRPRRRQWSRSEFRGRTRPTARSPAAGQHCPPHPLHGPFPPLEAHRLHVLDRPRSTHDQTPYTTARAGGRGPRRSLAVPASNRRHYPCAA